MVLTSMLALVADDASSIARYEALAQRAGVIKLHLHSNVAEWHGPSVQQFRT